MGYYIEGIPHSANGLSVNQHTPPDIVLTDESFTCTAFFQPHLLDANIVLANGIIQKHFEGQVIDIVPVRLEVKLIDIWAVSEFVKGEQHDLFPYWCASRCSARLPPAILPPRCPCG